MVAAAAGQLLDGVQIPGLEAAPATATTQPGADREPAAWPPLPEPQAKVAASAGVAKEVLVSGVSVSIANTVTNPLGARQGGGEDCAAGGLGKPSGTQTGTAPPRVAPRQRARAQSSSLVSATSTQHSARCCAHNNNAQSMQT